MLLPSLTYLEIEERIWNEGLSSLLSPVTIPKLENLQHFVLTGRFFLFSIIE